MKNLINSLKIVAFTIVWSGVVVAGAAATTYPMTANAQSVANK